MRLNRPQLLQELARRIVVLERPHRSSDQVAFCTPKAARKRAQTALGHGDLIATASHPIRVAIDGVDAAGKTTLADELVGLIEARGRPVIRASIDGFHRPRAERYRRGPDSPEGYYYDSFDYPAVRALLLDPLGPAGSRQYRRAAFDWRSDSPVEEPSRLASPDTILLFDGIFLIHPELSGCWDYVIFLHVDFEEVLWRAVLRDGGGADSAEAVRERYHRRYIPGQRLYLQAVRPQERADVVVDNNDVANPRLL